MAEYRIERVGRLIQEKIGALIVEGKIKDYRVNPFLSISRVSVSKDLVWADVYVSSFKSEGNTAKGVEGLQSAAGFIQSQLAGQMRIRQTPKLRFHQDAGIREGFDMVKKIEELQREENGKTEQED
ncbi:MAG: 30S ribosome-binding factor RbfA [Spirochaetaceae bacterium]|jgi:ribosome-binding factor A|nr:30S ribosome-binding factor RbfA [Spirochaetaceae bacterium]